MDEALRAVRATGRPVSARAARSAGSSVLEIRKARRRGELHPLWRGVDLLASTQPRWTACAVLSPDAVLSGPSADRVWGLDVPAGWREEITIAAPASRVRARAGLTVTARTLAPADITVRSGQRVTTLERTVTDILCTRPELGALWVADQVLARGVDPRRLAASLSSPRRGVRTGRARLSLADARSESPLETAVRVLLHRAAVMPPVLQHRVGLQDGRIARLDFAWPTQRLALEADGVAWHSAPEALLVDRARQNALVTAGWTVLRATWHDKDHDPGGLVRLVRTALATASATL